MKAALDGVPSDKLHTTYFATEGVHALVGDFLIRRGASIEELDRAVPCDELSIPCAMCEHCSLRDARVELLFGGEDDGAEEVRA